MPDVVPIRKLSSIFDEMQAMQDRVMQRAYEIFQRDGGPFGRDLDHWVEAERELMWKPPVELREKDGVFVLEVALSGVEAKDLNIEVTPEDIILKADVQHEHQEDRGSVHLCEFQSGKMFRSLHFPKRIDPDKVKAEFRNGLLRVTAGIAETVKAKQIKPEAA